MISVVELTKVFMHAGSDVLAARDSIEGDFLIVPEQACLKSGHVFLDDLTLKYLENDLQMPVGHGGGSLLSLVGNATELERRSNGRSTAAKAAPLKGASSLSV